MSFRHAVLSLFTVLLLGSVTRADLVEVSVVELDDGWFGYTYTLEDPLHSGLGSFRLLTEDLESIRNIQQPFDFMYYLSEDRITWARDAIDTDRDYLGAMLQFSFESLSPPGTVSYRVQGNGFLAEGELPGPGGEPTPPPPLTTPEPTSLGLLAVGSLVWICARRRKREPAE